MSFIKAILGGHVINQGRTEDMPSSETQGRSVGSGEKAGRKFSSTHEKSGATIRLNFWK